MEFHEILKKIMEEQGLTISEVARKCELTDSTVRSIFDRKQKKIALNIAFKLSKGLNISLERLNGETEPNIVQIEDVLTVNEQTHIKKYRSLDQYGQKAVDSVLDVEWQRCETEQVVKLLGAQNQPEPESSEENTYFMFPCFYHSMSAGIGEEADTEQPEYIRLNRAPPRGTSYVAPVRGDSMEPTYRDGDRLFVHAQEEIQPGQIGVFFMGGKQWVKELGDGVLLSHNPRYEPIPMREDIRCQGLVLGVCDDSYFE